MEKSQALTLAKLMDSWAESSISSNFEIDKLEASNNQLLNFHQWTNGKTVISGYNIMKIGEHNLYFLLIDWHRNEHYYLVIYSSNKSTTLAEIQRTDLIHGTLQFHWKYNPLKRDGKNLQRKAYFKQVFGSTSIHIPIPTNSNEVEAFLHQLFKLCANRVKADGIVDVFPIND